MNSSHCPCSDDLRHDAAELGIYRLGIADATAVSKEASEAYDAWIAAGKHAGMEYMERYGDVRSNPRLLLDGAQSIIMCAVSYYHGRDFKGGARLFASYAHGSDYHEVVSDRLKRLAAIICNRFGGETRVCVDTAPLRERYWATQAGLGFIGRNNQLIIPGAGSYFFLGAILSTVKFQPDEPCNDSCFNCKSCLKSCPGHAIGLDGAIDAGKCLSYLTIEHRGDLPPGTDICGHLYGCDECQRACPHNVNPPVTPLEELRLRKEIEALDKESILGMTQAEFSRIFSHSAIKRAKLTGLLRNARAIWPLTDK